MILEVGGGWDCVFNSRKPQTFNSDLNKFSYQPAQPLAQFNFSLS